MVIAVPPNSVIYAIALVHAIVSGYHGWSHDHSAVPTTLAQNIFIGTVVFASPLLAVLLLVRGRIYGVRMGRLLLVVPHGVREGHALSGHFKVMGLITGGALLWLQVTVNAPTQKLMAYK